jgi:hypothetical protein
MLVFCYQWRITEMYAMLSAGRLSSEQRINHLKEASGPGLSVCSVHGYPTFGAYKTTSRSLSRSLIRSRMVDNSEYFLSQKMEGRKWYENKKRHFSRSVQYTRALFHQGPYTRSYTGQLLQHSGQACAANQVHAVQCFRVQRTYLYLEFVLQKIHAILKSCESAYWIEIRIDFLKNQTRRQAS